MKYLFTLKDGKLMVGNHEYFTGRLMTISEISPNCMETAEINEFMYWAFRAPNGNYYRNIEFYDYDASLWGDRPVGGVDGMWSAVAIRPEQSEIDKLFGCYPCMWANRNGVNKKMLITAATGNYAAYRYTVGRIYPQGSGGYYFVYENEPVPDGVELWTRYSGRLLLPEAENKLLINQLPEQFR